MTATALPGARSWMARSCREALQGNVESPLGRGLNLACPPSDLLLISHGLDPIRRTVHLPNCTPKQDRSAFASHDAIYSMKCLT